MIARTSFNVCFCFAAATFAASTLAATRPVAAASVAEWTPFGVVWHDDDEDDGRARRSPQRRPLKPAKAGSKSATSVDGEPVTPSYKAKARVNDASEASDAGVLEGGPRPAIAPSAPPIVPFHGGFAAHSIVIDTAGRALYYVRGGGTAYRYPIAVGKVGFTWTGTEHISRKSPWPDWRPPEEMRERRPNLPELMTGGIRNPLGAMALYLGNSLYRIHGTNDASSIGRASSSGCFRMMNAYVVHLSSIAPVGTTVHVVSHLTANAKLADDE